MSTSTARQILSLYDAFLSCYSNSMPACKLFFDLPISFTIRSVVCDAFSCSSFCLLMRFWIRDSYFLLISFVLSTLTSWSERARCPPQRRLMSLRVYYWMILNSSIIVESSTLSFACLAMLTIFCVGLLKSKFMTRRKCSFANLSSLIVAL